MNDKLDLSDDFPLAALDAALDEDNPAMEEALSRLDGSELEVLNDSLSHLKLAAAARLSALRVAEVRIKQLERHMMELTVALGSPDGADGMIAIPFLGHTQHHSRACLTGRLHNVQAQLDYTRKWPNYCPHCNGWGGRVTSFSPDGEPGRLQEFDTCSYCTDRERCPRCGRHMADFSENCRFCGFDPARPDGLPEPAECVCEF